ncbi:MAG: 7-carboxy-7-deazaguanine synthase QueE [Planctomycetota bacterium]
MNLAALSETGRETTLRISEIFRSIQGEGQLAGTDSLFIRTVGCNLRCRWCDTPYTSHRPERGRHDSLDELLAHVAEENCEHVVLTGGEPLLPAAVAPFTAALRQMERHVTIETAGTVFRPVQADLISLSPKLSNSTPEGRWANRHEAKRDAPGVVRRFLREYETQIKFVVEGPDDLPEIDRWLDRYSPELSRVFFMPQARTASEYRRQEPRIRALADRRGVQFGPRLHVARWGDRRGV